MTGPYSRRLVKGNLDWRHDELAADLMDSRHQVGEIAMERLALRGGILDVVSMRLSWSNPQVTGYEVKVSRADFLVDIRAEKWRQYLQSVERLYFAVPAGLVDRDEVPPPAGLLYRGRHGWYSVKKPGPIAKSMMDIVARRTDIPGRAAMALLFRHYPAPWRLDGPGERQRLIKQGPGSEP